MENNEKQCSRNYNTTSASSGMVYVLGLIGAAIYFISQATGFWMGVLGFFKAMVWPAYLVYEALKTLGA